MLPERSLVLVFHSWASRFTGTKWREQQCMSILLCGDGLSDHALEGWLTGKVWGVTWRLSILLTNRELSPGALVLISQYSHLNNQECRRKLERSWKKTGRSSPSRQVHPDLVRLLQVIWKSLPLKLEQRVSLSNYFPLGNERQKGTRRELIMSVCWINQSYCLSFKTVKEIYEAKLLTQIGEDRPEQILPVHSGGNVRILKSCWEGRSAEMLWRQLMNTVRKKLLGDARKALASAEKDHTGYLLSQAPSLMCVLDKALGEKKIQVKKRTQKNKKVISYSIQWQRSFQFKLATTKFITSLFSWCKLSGCYANRRP